MPILTNPKWERFAQGLAAGKTADEAYAEAGYTKNRKNASRLKANEDIASRVAELQSRVADGVVISRQWVLEELVKVAGASLGGDHVKASDKRAALVDIAKIQGWIIDRTEHSGGLTISHEQALEALK